MSPTVLDRATTFATAVPGGRELNAVNDPDGVSPGRSLEVDGPRKGPLGARAEIERDEDARLHTKRLLRCSCQAGPA